VSTKENWSRNILKHLYCNKLLDSIIDNEMDDSIKKYLSNVYSLIEYNSIKEINNAVSSKIPMQFIIL